jgi:TonB-dependent receptor
MADPTQQQQFVIRGDARNIMAFLVERGEDGQYVGAPSDYEFSIADIRDNDNIVEEDMTAVYFQIGMGGELGGLPVNLTAGLRYEDTKVDSTSYLAIPQFLRWEDNNDFQLIRSNSIEPTSRGADYDNMLPSLDFDVGISDDLKARFSFGKSIARAGYGNLTAVVSGFGTVGSTLLGAQPTANASNPGLVPLESDNFDISLEWYFGDASYASAGLFEKRVSNFIGQEQVLSSWFGLRDQTNGPRAEAARTELENLSVAIDDTSLFVMMAVLDNPGDFPGGAGDVVLNGNQVDSAFAVTVATNYDLTPESNDPLMEFSTTTPVNNREASFNGAEFAVQHFFGDTGFGMLANYTVVNSDTSFDNTALPSVSQFALTGLSDTANLVAIYENFGFQARLAYNWRDTFLAGTNRGNSRNPTYVDEYTQVDLNLAYDISDALTVMFEGINLTEEDNRQYGRSERQLWFLEDQGARWNGGI